MTLSRIDTDGGVWVAYRVSSEDALWRACMERAATSQLFLVRVQGLYGRGGANFSSKLRELIATENECCPFYRFDFRPELERLTIGVDSPEHRPALDAIAAALGAGHNR